MARVCAQCHAELADAIKSDWCPACGGTLVEREGVEQKGDAQADQPATEVDHRSIVLPRRFASGGIITPR